MGMQSESWPDTEGQIICSRTEVDGDADSLHEYAIVQYRHTINGEVYVSNKIAFGRLHSCPRRIVEKYPVGAKVRVYFNPARPEQVTLETGISTAYIAFSLVVDALIGLIVISIMK